MKKNNLLFFLSLFIILISISYLSFIIAENKILYIEKFDAKKYKKIYENSQWMKAEPKVKNEWAIKLGYTGWDNYIDETQGKDEKLNSLIPVKGISDEDLYSYSGYEYIKGKNPILLNPEAPPLGKYLIGLSIILFNNQRVISVITAFLCLLLIFTLTKKITHSNLFSSIAVLLTTTNTLFTDQIIHTPQLELFQLFFILLFIFIFSIFKEKNKYQFLILSGIILGFSLSIKVFFLNYILVNSWLLTYYFLRCLLKREKIQTAIKEILFLNIITLFSFTLTYIMYFVHDGTLRSFLGTQKWIFHFYQQSSINTGKLLGSYLNLILFNKWKVWSEGYPIVQYEHWSFFWPITFITGLASCFFLGLSRKVKKNNLTLILISFIVVYSAFLFIVPIFPRYLLLLFIPLNILIAVLLNKLITIKK